MANPGTLQTNFIRGRVPAAQWPDLSFQQFHQTRIRDIVKSLSKAIIPSVVWRVVDLAKPPGQQGFDICKAPDGPQIAP
jgi:hypothetical protein